MAQRTSSVTCVPSRQCPTRLETASKRAAATFAGKLPESKAAAWLEEERTAEVYIYEDGNGFILGPFCLNELQQQIERCASRCAGRACRAG